MEAVPRLPMLSFDLRSSADKVDFAAKLKQYIRSHYNEDPTLYASGITGIDKMRREAVYPSFSAEGCSLLKRYYCQLHFMASRFPMRENEEAAITFSWKSLHSNSVITLNDVSLEMSSILYNIGALHSLLGAMDNRTTSEGMKMSCSHFQCAAWAFQHINEEYVFAKNLGFSKVLMSFMYHLCLAQAQECILEKSMMDNRKSAITAKVAVQVVDYYKHSLKLLGDWPKDENNPSDVTSLKLYKKWDKYLQFKIAYYSSISLLFQGQQSEDQQKMGERVAFYQAAFNKLEEAKKLLGSVENSDSMIEAVTFVNDVIEVKRKAAKNENEFIYHEEVPNISHLPEIKGASLVKGIPFNINDTEVCGSDLFSNIVPMKAHESSSMYSEEKAKLLRRINGLIEAKDEELETFLSMLDLDEIKSKTDGNKLPQELIDRCASLSAKPDAIQNLTDAMNKLSNIYQDVELMLTEIKELLKEEENHEKEYQQTVGKRPPSIAATDLTREAKKYQEAHAKASESNQTLQRAMVMHISSLKLLSLPLKELVNHLPIVTESPEVEAVTNEMRHLISKIDEMKRQRLMLSGQLRDMICQDDITTQVITYSGNKIEELFEQELKKYDQKVSLIEQNLAAQENILKALKEAYARYGSTRKNTGESHRKRSSMISTLIASYDAYEDLMSKSCKGLDFYKKLETNVSKLLQRVRGTCKVQDEEREQLLKSVRKPESGYLPSEIPPSNTLKLKDYLNIKKETGKLSLDYSNNVIPANSYYGEPLPQQNWLPGIRPAPVGSEETDTSYKGPSDSFRGFYQDQAKDQVWSNTFYSGPQEADQKLKYYLPQNPATYQNYSQNLPSYPQNQDVYPISSYSTSLPKANDQSYEPKSNYYDVHGSPNRCYNPGQSYNEPATNSSTNSAASSSYVTSDIGYTQPTSSNIYLQNEMPSYYGYSASTPAAYSASQTPSASQNTVPQPSMPSYASSSIQSEPTVGGYSSTVQQHTAYGQNTSTYNSSIPSHLPYGSSDSSQIPYSSAHVSGQPQSSTGYNNSCGVNQPSSLYSSSTTDLSSIQNPSAYPVNYQTQYAPGNQVSLPSGASGNFSDLKSEQGQTYQNVPTYQQLPGTGDSSNPVVSFITSGEHSTGPFGISNSPYHTQTSETPPQVVQQYASGGMIPQSSWNTSYNSSPSHNQQYFQSGNESLYTASQTPNKYAMTNSDVYKTPDMATANYSDHNYGGQYYTNQYGGTYAAQAESGSQNGNPVTYIQAGMDKQQAVTTTTFSNSEAKSSPVTNPSNVDLLAGLDFNINHSPLVPETAVASKKDDSNSGDTFAKSKSGTKILTKSQPSNSDSVQEKSLPKDVMGTMENVSQFAQEVEKYEKFVEGLTLKTLNGPTSLDLKWKEIVDSQEKISPLHIISVARCYPMKNRFPDILPYDDSRVELPSTKDDYINASRMQDLTKLTPPFILTQAPLPSTYADFWAMVFEQQVEVIVCLLSDFELDGQLYWPTEKGQESEMGKLKVSLQSSNVRSHWVERILSISAMETRATRVVVHIQFTAWPGSSFPESPGPFLSFSLECINFFTQQRSYNHPVVVHCISGVGRSGLFCLTIASILDIQAGKGIPDLANLAGRMCQFRKSSLRDREHLKFAYQAILYFCQDFLMKRGILTKRSTFEDKAAKNGKCHTRHPSEDFLVVPSSEVDQIQTGLEKLETDDSGKKEDDKNISPGFSNESGNVSENTKPTSDPASGSKDVLSKLDSMNFSLKMDPSDKSLKKKRFTVDSFNKNSSVDDSSLSKNDPLSQLDPLWTMKK